MNRRQRNPRRGRAGFTLAEVLIAMLILLMVTAVVAGGIPVAANAYYKVVDGANAQLLLSTTATLLRDELGTAGNSVTVEEDGSIHYKSSATGSASVIASENTGITITDYAGTSAELKRLLVSEKAATNGLYAQFASASCSGGVVTITELTVKKGGVELASMPLYEIRTGVA